MSARTTLVGLALCAALAAAGCEDRLTSPSSTTTSTSSSSTTGPFRVTSPGVIGPGGTASRSFTASAAGTATITVTNIAPATALVVGIGIPQANGTGCLLAYSAVARTGASASASGAVDAGTFCFQVYAPDTAAASVSYSVTYEYP